MQFQLAPTTRSVRQNLLLALGLAFLLLTGVQWFFTDLFLTRQLRAVESQNAFSSLQRVSQAIQGATDELDATVRDWAQWDDTYHYALGEPTTYGDDNLTPATFRRLRLGLLMVVRADGQVLFAKVQDEASGELADVPAQFAAVATGDVVASRPVSNGILHDVMGTFLISSQPTFDSAHSSRPTGRIVMGRRMNSLLPAVSRVSGVAVSMEPWRDAASVVQDAASETSRSGRSILALSKQHIDGYMPLDDIHGRSIALLHARMDRPLQATLHSVTLWLVFGMLVVGVSFCLAGLVVVQWRVVTPIEHMAAAVSRVGADKSGATRIDELQDAAEFVTLSRAINAMLEQIAQQQALRTDRDAAIEANRLKSDFLAVMSHEIRTPMNGVLGMCELLLRTHLDTRQRHLADTVLRSARSLLEILNDILDFSKIESGKLQLESATFAPHELLTSLSAPFISAASSKGVELSVNIDAQVPDLVIGDAMRLRQVLNNLIGNAVKFTAAGTIAVSCDMESMDNQYVWLRVSVADTGIGIAPDAQRFVFDAFSQAESNTTRRYGGTGLGLAIVSRLVTLMEGKLGLESTAGVGSRFWFTTRLQRAAVKALPAPVAEVEMHTGARFAMPRAPHVLLAEDHAVNREVLTEMLEVFGCQVTAVENGALALAQASQASFDMIIMDCQMPVMDGQTAATQMRQMEQVKARSRVHIVALTADATTSNMQRCFDAGMDDVVTKPVSHKRLRELVHQAVVLQASVA